MSRQHLGQRLENLYGVLSNPELLGNRGIGNEIGFYIFAYNPEDEEIVTAYLPKLTERLRGGGVQVAEFNLYGLVVEMLEGRKLLERSFTLEAERGSAGLYDALKKVVRPEKLIERISAQLTEPHDLVFLTGVGAAYPLVRSHTVLNNLHAVLGAVPLVMFYPGSYDGQALRLFNELKDDNYYRAFPLLEDAPGSRR